MTRMIECRLVTELVASLCIEANIILPADIADVISSAEYREVSPEGKAVLADLKLNMAVARKERIPICQDTGMAVVFVKIGQEVQISGGALTDAITAGVSKGYTEGYMRASIVEDPLLRNNTGDNTPPVIHIEIVPGNTFRITVAPKGFGSENMSALKMLKPSEGVEGVIDFVVDTVITAGANPCPPIILGIGIGGTMEKAALIAKQALLREAGTHNKLKHIAELEDIILDKVNRSGIGPGGLGGRVTALAVNIDVYPTHIAGLPVAVNISCHATRHATGSL